MEEVDTAHFELILLWGLIIKSSLVIITCWFCTVMLKRYAAYIRHSIWMIALTGIILLPMVSFVFPGWHTLNVRLNADAPPTSSDTPIIYQQVIRLNPGLGSTPAEHPSAVSAMEPAATQRGNDLLLPFRDLKTGDIVLILWGLGFVFLVLRLLLDLRQLRVFQRQLIAIESENISSIADGIRHQMGIKRETKIGMGPHIKSPVTWGLTKPVIALPPDAIDWTYEQLQTVLCHEFAHIKRYDYLWNVLSQIACAIYWFNPFVWIAGRHSQFEQEKACDEQVLLCGVGANAYAEHLLVLAKSHYFRNSYHGSIAMARHHTLQQRIKSILFANRTQKKGSTFQSRSLTLGTCFVTLLLVGTQIGYQDTIATYVWLEAENGALHGAMKKEQDVEASNASYIVAKKGQKNAGKENTNWAKFEFEVSTEGQYIIWGRVQAPSGNRNSFFVSINDSASTVWDIFGPDSDNRAKGWTWVRVQNREQQNYQTEAPFSYTSYTLGAGKHSLTLQAREQDTKIDQILITNDKTYRPRGFGQPSVAENMTYVWLEAEAGWTGSPIVQGDDEASSNGQFVWLPQQNTPPGQTGSGELNYPFDVKQRADYAIWGRVIAPSPSENSFFVSLDHSPFGIWDVKEHEPVQSPLSWAWQRIHLRENTSTSEGDPGVFSLEAGAHRLTLKGREPGTRIDRILVTNDLSFTPEGWGTTPGELRPSYLWVEAEEGMLSPPLYTSTDSTASGNRYIEVSKDYDSRQHPPSDGRAVYHLAIPTDGTYLMWTRVRATRDEGDSFWVRMDGGPWIRWNGITHGKTWHWEEIHDLRQHENPGVVSFELNAGQHVLEIAYREPWTKLDGFLITNDLNFAPASFSDDPIVLKREHLISASRAIQ